MNSSPRFSQLSEWLQWLEARKAFSNLNASLERVLPCAQALQLTDFSIPVILVAGTNGKGSTVGFLEAIYQTAGYRTAACTSPHLIDFQERLRINSKELSAEQWCEAFAMVDAIAGEQYLTYFEFATLAALWLICERQMELDVIMLEVGLGGRFDAMNVVNADIAVIATIALDHTAQLGNNREAIGFEKSGIMRFGKIAVCGDLNPPVSIYAMAEKLSVSLYCQQRDFDYTVSEAGWSWHNKNLPSAATAVALTELPLPQLPLQNAATSLAVIALLQARLPVNELAIQQGLSTAAVPGRMQWLQAKPEVIVDVAHNPEAARYLAQQLPLRRRNTGTLRAVVAMCADKDIEQTLAAMRSIVDVWYAAPLALPRTAAVEQLLQYLPASTTQTCATVMAALQQALTDASDNDTIVVFGSFFTVGPIMEIMRERRET
ncbi:MAG: bifunctional tetrahydrofolate synthase/dihydrofolate synthase [Gammaproteobacteria bacterium]|nr:bifunctional tetrahydrofolate synthase/dihydrofolate synthase [Gammaproteobacteria bacterium]